MITTLNLANLGWRPLFQQQLSIEEWSVVKPFRVIDQHRTELCIAGETGVRILPLLSSMPTLTIGDWILLDENFNFLRLLERFSIFRRKSAGTKVSEQLIAANVDTIFIVCSLNEDFNLNRIERYLALAHEASVFPVVVLSKADLCQDVSEKVSLVQKLGSALDVMPLTCTSVDQVKQMENWCSPGQTIVLLGSSGAGKSTLTNTLLGSNTQFTKTIRDGDGKGRHTTTRRSIFELPCGGLLIDTPGMREIQIADCEAGVRATFSDIDELSRRCRFNDCNHQDEPGCAVKSAVESGVLDERRLFNYRKLLKEQAMNSASLAEKRAKDRQLGKFYKRVQKGQSALKGK